MVYGKIPDEYSEDFEKYVQNELFPSTSLFGRIGLVLVCIMIVVLEFMYIKFNVPLLLMLAGAGYYSVWLVRDSIAKLRDVNKLLDEGNFGVVYLPIEKKYFESTSKSKKVEHGKWHFVIQGYDDYTVDEDTAEDYDEDDLYPCLLYNFGDDTMRAMLLPDWMVEQEDD